MNSIDHSQNQADDNITEQFSSLLSLLDDLPELKLMFQQEILDLVMRFAAKGWEKAKPNS